MEHPRDKLVKFLRSNPNPPDEKFHKLAEQMGMSPHDLEEIAYKMLTEYIARDPAYSEGRTMTRGVKMKRTVAKKMTNDGLRFIAISQVVEAFEKLGLGDILLEDYAKSSDLKDIAKQMIKSIDEWIRHNESPTGGAGSALQDTVRQIRETYKDIDDLSNMLRKLAEWITGKRVR